jgi:sugar/nucleoside kinase (ribokinase family)
MRKKEFDVLVVGELNIDIILNEIDSFPEIGKEKLANKMDITLGSSSAIFASNLSNLGVKVAFLGKIGKDQNGDFVIDSLKDKGVDTSMIIRSQEYNTGATIVLSFLEDRANVTYPGAMDHLLLEDIKTENLESARHLHFSSYFMQPGIKPGIQALFRKAKSAGLSTSMDPQWDPAEKWDLDYKSILPMVDVFLPNEVELNNITGTTNIEDAFQAIQDYCNIVVVKSGNNGSTLFDKGKTFHADPFLNTSVVDAIGAGDSFNAGFIAKFIKSKPLTECQRYGNLMGAISTTKAGGTTAFSDLESVMDIARTKFNFKEGS